MTSFLLKTAVFCAIVLPAAAQPIAPAAPDAPPAVDAHIAHHDRVVARRAYRHGNYRKARAATHAANNAAADAHTPQ
jgi:hypothetical protein